MKFIKQNDYLYTNKEQDIHVVKQSGTYVIFDTLGNCLPCSTLSEASRIGDLFKQQK